jgi:transcriptional regulator with XRE-family HTH domain
MTEEAGPPNRYGARQRDLRVAKGLTLRKFAEALGVSPTYVSGIENGTLPPPTPDRLTKIAELLETSLDDLIGLAGRWDDVAKQAVEDRPEFVRLFRAAKDLSREQVEQLSKQAEELSEDGDGV